MHVKYMPVTQLCSYLSSCLLRSITGPSYKYRNIILRLLNNSNIIALLIRMRQLAPFIVIFAKISLVFSQPMVKVEQGWILGATHRFENDFLNVQKDIDVFLGIPYAEPPVGDGRFKAPLPKEPWEESDVYNATYNRDVCMQSGMEAAKYFMMSEDCLHLNVYTPNPRVSWFDFTDIL